MNFPCQLFRLVFAVTLVKICSIYAPVLIRRHLRALLSGLSWPN